MKKPLITIGILNMNGLKRLKKVIPTYIKQDYKNKEILIVDNGSTDGSLEYLKKFKNLKILEMGENKGYGAGKNILVSKSRGIYILMLDNDIALEKNDFLSNIYEEYVKLDSPGFLSPIVKDFGKKEVECLGLFYNKLQNKMKFDKVYGRGKFIVPGYMGNVTFFRKKLFLELGRFDEIYPFNIDDYDLSARAWLAGNKNYITTNQYVIHHGIETRTNLNSLCWKNKYYLAGFSRMIWKNYRIKNIFLYFGISGLWIFYKSLRTSVKYRSLSPLGAYFYSLGLFIRDFRDTLGERKNIQKNRRITHDIFLRIGRFQEGEK
jgi:GT2 family glycosyltransferase